MPFPLTAPIEVHIATQPSQTVEGSMAALITGLRLEGAQAEGQGTTLRFRLSPFRRPLRWFGDPLMFVTGGSITLGHSEGQTSLTGWVSFTDTLLAWAGAAVVVVALGLPWWGAVALFLGLAFFVHTAGQAGFEQWVGTLLREVSAGQDLAAVAP